MVAEFALITELAAGVTHALHLRLHELRRRCLAISATLWILIISAISIHARAFKLSPILLHALSFKVAFACVEKERARLVMVSGALTFILRNVRLKHDGFAQLKQEKLFN